jgi:hypothetical protein
VNENVIKKIELDIDGVGITLTPQQAKKLQGALNELLGVEKEKEYIPQPYFVRPSVWPFRPYWYGETFCVSNLAGTAATNINGVLTSYNAGEMKLSVQ